MNRKMSWLLIIVGLACGSCATTSSMSRGYFRPKIKIGSEFVRHDKSSGIVDIESRDEGSLSADVLTEQELYVEIDQRIAKRFIMLETFRLDRDFFWATSDFSDPSWIDHGVAKLGGKDYQYHSRFLRTNVPSGAGYTKPQCLFLTLWERDLTDQIRFRVVYAEDVTQFGLPCGAFENGLNRSAKTREYIEAFNQRATEAFQVLP